MTVQQQCQQCLSELRDDSLLAITLHHLLKQVDAQNEIDDDAANDDAERMRLEALTQGTK